jgi:hypothetical protein
MGRHASVPDPNDRHGIISNDTPAVPGNHIKEDVANPPANKDPKDRDVSYDIRNLLFLNDPKLSPGESDQNQIGDKEAHHVGETIPPKLNRFRDLKNDRIKIVDVGGEHERISYHPRLYRKPMESGNDQPPHKSEIAQ